MVCVFQTLVNCINLVDMEKTLIVEGGGFKTSFTAGVLDGFMACDYFPFDSYMGVSGGSIAVTYYISRQYRKCLDAMRVLVNDEHFMNFRRTFGKEGYMDIDYLEKIAKKTVPIDFDKLHSYAEGKRIVFVATNRRYGNPEYFEPSSERWIPYVIASCTLPFVTKGKYKIDGKAYFDGGWSDPIPVIKAYDEGSRDILVLRTYPENIYTSQSWSDYFGSIYFSSRPELSQTFAKSYEKYNEAIEFMQNPPADLKIKQISPEDILQSGTYKKNEKTLLEDYRHGLDLGIQHFKSQSEEV